MSKQKKDYLSFCLRADSDAVLSGKGGNIIPPPEREPMWRAYLAKFKDPIIIVLLVVFVFSVGLSLYEIFIMGEGWSLMFEPAGVLVALLLATGVGFIFEVKANKEFEILNKVKDSRPIKVLRIPTGDSKPRLMQIAKQDVVVGDIVRLESGDEIPADGILKEGKQLRVDESNFTGETYANKYVDESDFDRDATYQSNFLLRGSTVIEGNGVMLVKAVGVNTEEGRGVALASEGSDVKTPLNRQLEQLGTWISKASFVIAMLIIVGRMLYYWLSGGFDDGFSWIKVMEFVLASIMIAVTLIVVAVPEGLPMSITVSLALSMRRMLKENSLVRKLHACETMGAATVICTDKTGTLTKNRMTVMEFEAWDESLNDDPYYVSLLENVYCNMATNSTAELSTEDDGTITVIGNPTEGALLRWLKEREKDYTTYRESHVVVDQQPFSSETKTMTTTVSRDGVVVRYVKGAPEIVMSMCDSFAGGRTREHYESLLLSFQQRAMRTLGFAMQTVNSDGTLGEMLFLCIVGIADPIRDDVAEAIDTCMNSAGVRVIIVTGDTPGTACEIGRQIGLITSDEEGQIVTGPEFAALSDEDARELLKGDKLKIISRARPDDKARLVMLLQSNGEVVAVTGDGTNDAPALSKAQVGLSMGDGTSRAKEASDITIIDNSFASINKAIMWGRSLYLNIRRFIIFQMTINLCACLIVLAGAFMGLDSPLTVTQMLWVNLIMDTFAAMALSSLPPDRGVLSEKPRKSDSHIIDRGMVGSIVGGGMTFFFILVALWQFLWHSHISSMSEMLTLESLRIFIFEIFSAEKVTTHLTGYEMGIFFSIFVMLQFWNLFNAKYFRTSRSLIIDLIDLVRAPQRVKESYNGMYLMILGVILGGQIVIVTFAGQFFGVSPLSVMDWVWICLITMPVLLIPDTIRTIKCAMRRH